jgi:hypothetical protein
MCKKLTGVSNWLGNIDACTEGKCRRSRHAMFAIKQQPPNCIWIETRIGPFTQWESSGIVNTPIQWI